MRRPPETPTVVIFRRPVGKVVGVTEAAVSRAIIEGEVEVDASDELRFRGPDADDFSCSGDVR